MVQASGPSGTSTVLRVLVLGAGGQVGQALLARLSRQAGVVCVGADRARLDVQQVNQLLHTLDAWRPDVVVNAAAYTSVDAAETDVATCWQVNATAVAVLARWCAAHGCWLVHFSSDYVYAGEGTLAHREQTPLAPLNTYGASKAAGDLAVGASGCAHVILRTGWVLSARGKNFLTTVLQRAQQGVDLQVVDDQWGTPTPAPWLAEVTHLVLTRLATLAPDSPAAKAVLGVYHATPSGVTQWCELAQHLIATVEKNRAPWAQVVPISSAMYAAQHPRAAKRPHNSRLDCSKLRHWLGIELPHWQAALAPVLATWQCEQGTAHAGQVCTGKTPT